MANVALVSKDTALAKLVSDFLKKDGHEVTIFQEYNLPTAVKKTGGFDVIVMDDHEIKSTDKYESLSSPKLIILGDLLRPSSVKKIIHEGAWDCISKPLMIDGKFIPSTVEDVRNRLINSIAAATERNQQEYDIKNLDRAGIIGESNAIKSCLASLIPAIKSDLSILIMGETGTGKELFAQAVKRNSSRSNKPFIPLNCATITETIADGILFGWEKDIHSRANKAKDGLLIEAHEGTLFLDEIGDLSPENQTRLLSAIQEKAVTRLGASETTPADFRVVAATNKNIFEMMEKGFFREDLFYRISDFVITIPPLRDRKEDIKLITDYYITDICEKHKITPTRKYTEDFLEALQIWDWPGNVRELMTAVRSAIFMDGNVTSLNVHHLSTDLRASWIANLMARNFDLWQATMDEMNMGVGDPYHDRADNNLHDNKIDNNTVIDINFDPPDGHVDGPDFNLTLSPGQPPTLDKVEREYLRQLWDMYKMRKFTAAQVIDLSGLKKDAFYDRLEKHGLKTKK